MRAHYLAPYRAAVLGDHEEIVDDLLRGAGKLLAQLRVLGGDAYGARVEMTLAHHRAPHHNQRHSGEPKLLGAK